MGDAKTTKVFKLSYIGRWGKGVQGGAEKICILKNDICLKRKKIAWFYLSPSQTVARSFLNVIQDDSVHSSVFFLILKE